MSLISNIDALLNDSFPGLTASVLLYQHYINKCGMVNPTDESELIMEFVDKYIEDYKQVQKNIDKSPKKYYI